MENKILLVISVFFIGIIFFSGCSLDVGDTKLEYDADKMQEELADKGISIDNFREGLESLGLDTSKFSQYFSSVNSKECPEISPEMLQGFAESRGYEEICMFAKEEVSSQDRNAILQKCNLTEEEVDEDALQIEEIYDVYLNPYEENRCSEGLEVYCSSLDLLPESNYLGFPIRVNMVCIKKEICGSSLEECQNKCDVYKGCLN